VIEISENYKLIIDFLLKHTLYYDSTIEIELYTLIQSDGGTRPEDVQQPANDEFAKVLIPTDS